MRKINSRANYIIKEAIKLKQKKYRNSQKTFLIEGKTMFLESLRQQQHISKAFIDINKQDDYESFIAAHPEIEWYLVESRIMQELCEVESPQGIAATIRMKEHNLTSLLKNKALFLLYLDYLSDPGNMGTIIRTGWAFGVDAVLLNQGCVDPYNPKVVRASMGGIFNVPVLEDITIADLLALKEEGYQLLCSSPSAGNEIYKLNLNGPVVVVIGNEARGASNEVSDICNDSFRIPTKQGVNSLNAAVACGIILSEAWKKRKQSPLS